MAREQDVLLPIEQTETGQNGKPIRFRLEDRPRKMSYQSRDKRRKRAAEG